MAILLVRSFFNCPKGELEIVKNIDTTEKIKDTKEITAYPIADAMEQAQEKIEEATKIEEVVKTEITPKKEIQEEKPKKEKKPKEKKVKEEIPERYDRPCRSINNLYTINATVKIGNDKFVIQRVVEEKNEKLANIAYDKQVKKEFGKPKSVTKRTCKEYENGEEEFCKTASEPTIPVREKTPEEIELEQKIEILQSEIGLFKVEFGCLRHVRNKFLYLYGDCVETIQDTIRSQMQSAMKNDRDCDLSSQQMEEQIEEILSDVKNITRLDSNAIKMDKGALRHIADTSVEEFNEMLEKFQTHKQKLREEAIKLFDELEVKGYKFHLVKVKFSNIKMQFVEFGRNENEVIALATSEERFRNALHNIPIARAKNLLGSNKAVEESFCGVKTLDELLDDVKEAKVDVPIDSVTPCNLVELLSKRGDFAHRLYYTTMGVEGYLKLFDKITMVKAAKSEIIGTEGLMDKLKEDLANAKKQKILSVVDEVTKASPIGRLLGGLKIE